MSSFPCLVRFTSGSGQARYRLGDRLVDRYLEFVAGRCRPSTLRAVAFDLKAFFTVVRVSPVEVTAADVFEFLAHQRGDRTVVRLADRESGLSARTIARRLSSVSGLYAYLVARGDTPVAANPVPRGLLTRREGGSRRSRTAPLVRVPRTLPRILPPAEADRLVAALRTHRDRAMVGAMLLAGLRRCEVLGLRFCDVQVADRRLVIVEGKGGHHRVVPVAGRFFAALGAYLHDERPATARTDRVFVVLPAPGPAASRAVPGSIAAAEWAQIRAAAPQATATIQRYLQRLVAFLAPGSVDAAENALRQFARWMVTDAGLDAIAAVRRDDIEDYKAWLAIQPRAGGRVITAETCRQRIRTVRAFFERIIE
jgi:integrase/recombinase XerD